MMGMDYIRENNLIYKTKSIFSYLYGIILWSTALPSSTIQISKQYCSTSPVGLKTLIYPRDSLHHQFIIHSCKILSPSSLPSSSLFDQSLNCNSSSWLDDLLGTESGVYLDSPNEETRLMEKHDYDRNYYIGKRNQEQQCEMRRKDYPWPPTIPLLARTGNLPGHMPWILTRQYIDGRLILREERLKHHEYFESSRENGRLILKLVPLDDTVRCNHSAYDDDELELQELELIEEEVEEKTQETNVIEEEEEDGDDDQIDIYKEIMDEKLMATSASSMPKSCLKNASERHGDLRKCFTYAGKMISDSYLTCNANAHRKGDGSYMAQSGSGTTLTITINPMTTVASVA